jgi:hypothetical protein
MTQAVEFDMDAAVYWKGLLKRLVLKALDEHIHRLNTVNLLPVLF